MIDGETIEKLQRADHDALIRLETKMDSLGESMRRIETGFADRITKLEVGIDKINRVHDETNPIESVKKLNDLYQWIHDFRLTYKIIAVIIGIISSIIGYTLAVLTQVFHLFGVK